MKFKRIIGICTGVAALIASVYTISVKKSDADNYVSLPGGHITQTLLNGTVVNIDLTREHALVSPPMVSVFTSRNVWTSGAYYVTAPGASKITLTAGYLLACQIRYNSGNYAWGNAGIFFGTSSANKFVPSGNAFSYTGNKIMLSVDPGTNRGQLTVSPGSTKFYSVLGNTSPSLEVPLSGGGISYDDVMFQVDECAGYASARAMATAEVTSGGETSSVTMWGKPFSIS